MATKKTEAKTVTIKQIGSPIRRKGDQRQALIKKEADLEARRAMAAGRRGVD